MADPGPRRGPVDPPPATARGECQVTVYTAQDYGGESATTGDDQPALSDPFDKAISSIQVNAGTWNFFVDTNYGGAVMRLGPGQYQYVGDDWDNQISSFRCLQANSAADAIEFTVVNRSAIRIRDLYVALEQDTNWGNDRLVGSAELATDESVTITVIAGNYQVRLADDRERLCEITAHVALTSAATWEITDDALSHCQGFGN